MVMVSVLTIAFVKLATALGGRKSEVCEIGDTTTVAVICSVDGTIREEQIDRCIAPIVQALNVANIVTTESCCGHGRPGVIFMADGRELEIKTRKGEVK